MSVKIINGDCREVLRSLPERSVHMCCTSPPYFGLRDYGIAEQIGLEANPVDYVAELVAVFREVRRVLRDDGTLWLNLGDSYAATGRRQMDAEPPLEIHRGTAAWGWAKGRKSAPPVSVRIKTKDLIGIPWRVAFALQADGWYLRQDIIWSKPNPMPESVQDRCTKAHEYLFLLSKSPRYFYDADAIREPHAESSLARVAQNGGNPTFDGSRNRRAEALATSPDTFRADQMLHANGANKRSVWTVATQPFAEAHFATFPPDLIIPAIKAGCPEGGTVLDPFGGAGTTGLVADRLQRDAILIELNPAYADMARRRILGDAPLFAEVA